MVCEHGRRTNRDGDKQVPDLETTVDHILGVRVGVADSVQSLVEIVRHDTVAGPLGEEARGNTDKHAVAVSLCLPKDSPALSLELLLELESGVNLLDLELDELILLVAIGVGLCEDVESLFGFTLGDEETGRFVDEPDEDELEDRGECLYKRRNTPRPIALDLKSTKGEPRCDNGTKVPKGVVDGCEGSSVLRMTQFGDEKRRASLCDGNTCRQWSVPDHQSEVSSQLTKTNDESSSDEHPNRSTNSLQYDANDADDAANNDSNTTTVIVCDEGEQRKSDDTTNRHDSIE